MSLFEEQFHSRVLTYFLAGVEAGLGGAIAAVS
jgi:hypothetical protein